MEKNSKVNKSSSQDGVKVSSGTVSFCKSGKELKKALKEKPLEINTIFNLNCIEGLKLMPDNSVTITITSPPYGIKSPRGKLYDVYDDTPSPEEQFRILVIIIKELIRISKYYVFFNIQFLNDNKEVVSKIQYEFRNYLKDVIIWSKSNPTPAINETTLTAKWEYVFVFAKPEIAKSRSFKYAFYNNRMKGPLNTNLFETPNAGGEKFDGKKECKAIFPKEFVY